MSQWCVLCTHCDTKAAHFAGHVKQQVTARYLGLSALQSMGGQVFGPQEQGKDQFMMHMFNAQIGNWGSSIGGKWLLLHPGEHADVLCDREVTFRCRQHAQP